MPLLTRSPTPGSHLTAALGLAGVALMLAALLVANGGPVLAQDAATLGVDMLPENNAADFVGTVQTCSEAQMGDQIAVDIFVRDVQSLVAWEFRIAFDHNMLHLETTESDFALFLLSAGTDGSIFPSLSERETDGRYFLAAADIRGEADSGSGVLARLQFTVVGEGRSPLTISSDPAFLRPRLTNGSGQTIADIDGDGLWDDSITDGEVAVGEPCSAPQPPQPPQPTPVPDAGSGSESEPESTTGVALVSAVPALIVLSDSAPSGSDPSDSGGGSAASNGEDSSAASNGEDGSAGSDGEGESAASAGEDVLSASGGEDSIRVSYDESGEGALGSGPDGNQPDAEDAEDETESSVGRIAARGDGSSGWSWWLIGAIIAAALVVGTGGSLLLHSLRTR